MPSTIHITNQHFPAETDRDRADYDEPAAQVGAGLPHEGAARVARHQGCLRLPSLALRLQGTPLKTTSTLNLKTTSTLKPHEPDTRNPHLS